MNKEKKRSLLLGKISDQIVPKDLAKETIDKEENLFVINHCRFSVAMIGSSGCSYKDNSNKRFSKIELGLSTKYLATMVLAAYNGVKSDEFILYVTKQDDRNVIWNYRITAKGCYVVETTTLPGAQYALLVQNQGVDTELMFKELKTLDGPQSKPESTWIKYRSNTSSIIETNVEESMVVFSLIYTSMTLEAKTTERAARGVVGAGVAR